MSARIRPARARSARVSARDRGRTRGPDGGSRPAPVRPGVRDRSTKDTVKAVQRHLCLNVYLRNSGYHESAWKVTRKDPRAPLEAGYYADLARTAERGILDAVFLPDSPGMVPFRAEYLPTVGLDPLELLASVAVRTDRIGLIATVSTTYTHPWETARRLATLDFLSGGRAGWNIVTTVDPVAAGNFGDLPHPERTERYARAEEFVEVALKLWDGWEEGAALFSKESGRWADPGRIRAPLHQGRHFSVRGPLPLPRSPQGRPLLTQAGSSREGIRLAAAYADAVFTPQADPESSAAFRQDLRAQAAGFGRAPERVLVLPGLSFVLADTERGARQVRASLEEAASSEFRWRNLAHLAGLDAEDIDPDAPFPPELLSSAARTSFGQSIYAMARQGAGTFRDVAQRLSALPGGLDFTGTPEQLAGLITHWWRQDAADGFTVMPHLLPDQLDLFVDHVVPILQRSGLARTEYAGTTLREHVGCPA
ncbi:monooxygenase [Streptomyces sulfonofaciens]|uniref:Monooxygenase n=1 Tax=Streptomyces sulfonofaciens TaxID=68272 RepID=A0A919GAD0_9ACTN|nr:monooxygenase [Streptomyces sulfonofaciens]